MPRQPRYFIPHLPQHVIQRGVDQQATFFQDSDYRLYLQCLRDAAQKYGCQIHAYVLMTNHTHLVLTPENERSIPLVMQEMGRTYVQTINRSYNRSGTLWQGRYKASLIQSARYLLTCYQYIELNPVRARMVSAPGQYSYSSYAHNALGKENLVISAHSEYQSLGKTSYTRRRAYRQLFESELSPLVLKLLRDTTNSCQILGNNEFKDQIEAMLGRSVRPSKAGRPADKHRSLKN